MYWNSEDEVKYPDLVPSTMSINEKSKLAFSGTLTLNFHQDSAKYDREAVIAVYSKTEPSVKERPLNNGWTRNEIVLPLSSATYEFFLECAYQVKARLEGVK